MTYGTLMKVKRIAECSPWGILQYFWPALSDKSVLKTNFGVLSERPLKTGFTVHAYNWNAAANRIKMGMSVVVLVHINIKHGKGLAYLVISG